jgi:hypothetical protein
MLIVLYTACDPMDFDEFNYVSEGLFIAEVFSQ